ncbi:MAG: hypothetical protein II445_11305, partial [Muribaculaceae bacterium]|nr:hypothetical protein [Muribaculaceae bacterium]
FGMFMLFAYSWRKHIKQHNEQFPTTSTSKIGKKRHFLHKWGKSGEFLTKKNANHLKFKRLAKLFVNRLGFEPRTHSFEGCCSIQLSYRSQSF